jgi:protein-tyrosine phosphatase
MFYKSFLKIINFLHIPHSHNSQFNFNYMFDGIYAGNNQCCVMGLSEFLKNEGVTIDISLEDEKLDEPKGVELYLWVPVKDHFPPTLDQLNYVIDNMQKFVSQNKKIYIHCKNGHGRTSTFLAGYLIKYKNHNVDSAIELIKKQRPSAHLADAQVSFLREIESKLKNN